MRSHLTSLLLLTLALSPCSTAELVLNEIRIDQNSSDTDEYVEIFSTEPPESIDGVTLIVIGDGSGTGPGTIEAVVPLDGIDADPLALVADSEEPVFPNFPNAVPDLETNLNFENGDNVTFLLVKDFSGANGDDLDADDDGQLEVQPWAEILDGVGLRTTRDPGGIEYSEFLELESNGPDGDFVPAHSFRPADGQAAAHRSGDHGHLCPPG